MPIIYTPLTTNRKLNAIASLPNGRDKTKCIMTYYQSILQDPVTLESLKEDDSMSHQRRLQSGDSLELQKVTVEGCIFENNGQGPATPITINGVIWLASANNELVLSNSIFRNNTYTEPTDGVRCFLSLYFTKSPLFLYCTHYLFSTKIIHDFPGQWVCNL
jgi:hypothetical protein